jgi:formylmethanofuran dehydrogenase subunit D
MAVDIGSFIKTPEYDIIIITYRDVFQAAACEEDRFGEECQQLSAFIVLDRAQLKHMGIKDGANVRLTSEGGSVVVKAKASSEDEQKGLGFMVNSPWSNALVSANTYDGFIEYKHITARISASKDDVIDITSLRNTCIY